MAPHTQHPTDLAYLARRAQVDIMIAWAALLVLQIVLAGFSPK